MSIERRKPEAAGLRQLFQQQWDHIGALLDQFAEQREAARRQIDLESEAIESVVEGTNTRLRLVTRYRNRLRKSVKVLLEYVDALVQQLPPPIVVSAERFVRDHHLNAFFVNKQAITEVFSRSHELQRYFRDPLNAARSHACVVMFMARKEKEVLGPALIDGMLTRDVKQITVSFTDHLVTQPCADEAEARSALEKFLFDNFVEYVNYRLVHLENGQDEAHRASRRAPGPEAAGPAAKLKNPETYLEELSRILEKPEDLLRLESNVIRVSRIGIKIGDDSGEAANELTLHELQLGQRTHGVVALMIYPRAEMISQDTLLREASRRLGA